MSIDPAAKPDFVTAASLAEASRSTPAKELAMSAIVGVFDLLWRRGPKLKPKDNFLNLGAGPSRIEGWCNADLPRLHDLVLRRTSLPDWMLDATKPWKCLDDIWDGIFCEHVLEHLTYSDAVKLLTEAHRTLKHGAWIRLVTPDLAIYVRNYASNGAVLPYLGHPAIAMSNLTQSWGHVSVWDGDLTCEALRMAGFCEVAQTSFGIGRDQRIVKDQRERSVDSLYVEARKR